MTTRPVVGINPGHPKTNPHCVAHTHGTAHAYNKLRCRCTEAREDWRLFNKRRRQGRHQFQVRVNPAGTVRRLQGLAWAGWSKKDIAARLGVHPSRVTRLRDQTPRYVAPATAAAVRRLALELADLPGTSTTVRWHAQRQGWVSLAAWDDIDDPQSSPVVDGGQRDRDYDEVLVARALAGRARWTDLTHPDRVEVLRRAKRDGVGVKTLAPQLGVHHSTLTHYRTRHEEKEVAA